MAMRDRRPKATKDTVELVTRDNGNDKSEGTTSRFHPMMMMNCIIIVMLSYLIYRLETAHLASNLRDDTGSIKTISIKTINEANEATIDGSTIDQKIPQEKQNKMNKNKNNLRDDTGSIKTINEANKATIDGSSLALSLRKNDSIAKPASTSMPMPHPLEPVGHHFAWHHIEKTGSSFVNALFHYACANGPTAAIQPRQYGKKFADKGFQCDKKFSGLPFLTTESESENAFHSNLNLKLKPDVYEYNKGRLVGMIREPKSHRVSLAEHKYVKSGYSTKVKDGRFSSFLEYVEGFLTHQLAPIKRVHGGYGGYSCQNNCPQEIELAKQRLTEGFQYVGITDRWAESMCLFFFKFSKPGNRTGTTEPLCHPAVFANPNPHYGTSQFNFTEEDLEYLKTYDDPNDRQIYNHAVDIFEADMRRYGVTREACAARGCWPKQVEEQVEEQVEGRYGPE